MITILDDLYAGPVYRAKDKQKSLIFRAVRTTPGLTRKQLAQSLGLRASTVSNLVHQLLRDRLLYEGKTQPGNGKGRPQVSLFVDHDRFTGIVLYFVSMDLKGVLVNSAYQVIAEHTTTLSDRTGPEELTAAITETVRTMERHNPASSGITGCGIAFPGYVDSTRERWVFAARWPRLRNYSLQKIAQSTAVPIACRRSLDAELRYLLDQTPDFRKGGTLLVHWGFGIGSAYAHDGTILRTSAGGFGEIGHTPVATSDDGALMPCVCGRRGCLETAAALWALLPKLTATIPGLPSSEAEFAHALQRHALYNHPVVSQATDVFVQAMVLLYTLFVPDRIVLYGPFTNNDIVYQRVTEGIHAGVPDMFTELLTVQRMNTGFIGDIYGASVDLFRDTFRRVLTAD